MWFLARFPVGSAHLFAMRHKVRGKGGGHIEGNKEGVGHTTQIPLKESSNLILASFFYILFHINEPPETVAAATRKGLGFCFFFSPSSFFLILVHRLIIMQTSIVAS